MFPYICFRLEIVEKLLPKNRGRQKGERWSTETEMKEHRPQHSVPFKTTVENQPRVVGLRSQCKRRNEEIEAKKQQKRAEMANKVPNLSDLIHRVASSCLLHPVARVHGPDEGNQEGPKEEEEKLEGKKEEERGEEEEGFRVCEEEEKREGVLERMREMEGLLEEVFEGVSAMKRAYVSLQEAHCPWDPEKMRVADVAVVAELRRLGRLRERFRRGGGGGVGGGGNGGRGLGPYREAVVGPYEAAVEELKREVRVKEAEVEGLKERLRTVSTVGKKGRFHPSHRRVSCSSQASAAAAPTPELFISCMSQVKQASKTFTSLLLSRMRSARWDIEAAARSIQAPSDAIPAVQTSHHSKHAIESYVLCKLFQGFENETFYIDGSLSSLLHPSQFRRDCLSQFNGIKPMDPTELLGILPTCHFGRFCCKKYLAVVHQQMEESLFGGVEQRREVLAGNHPRTEFYAEFLSLAKAVWLLHLVAFSLDPAPSHFQASRGADYHPEYMESVVRFSGGRVEPAGHTSVGFPVSPGFKLGNGTVIKSRVYLVLRM